MCVTLLSADARTLFVKGLADSVDKSDLEEFFSEASDIRIPMKEGSHKGYDCICSGLSSYILEFVGQCQQQLAIG